MLSPYQVEQGDSCKNFKLFEEYRDEDDVLQTRTKCVTTCPEGYWERHFKPTNDDNMEFKICEKCPDGCKRCDLGHFNKVYLWGDEEAPETINENVVRYKVDISGA